LPVPGQHRTGGQGDQAERPKPKLLKRVSVPKWDTIFQPEPTLPISRQK